MGDLSTPVDLAGHYTAAPDCMPTQESPKHRRLHGDTARSSAPDFTAAESTAPLHTASIITLGACPLGARGTPLPNGIDDGMWTSRSVAAVVIVDDDLSDSSSDTDEQKAPVDGAEEGQTLGKKRQCKLFHHPDYPHAKTTGRVICAGASRGTHKALSRLYPVKGGFQVQVDRFLASLRICDFNRKFTNLFEVTQAALQLLKDEHGVVQFKTIEHGFRSMLFAFAAVNADGPEKATLLDHMNKIRIAPTGAEARALGGRGSRGMDITAISRCIDVWRACTSTPWMRELLRCRFECDPGFAACLHSHGAGAYFVYHSHKGARSTFGARESVDDAGKAVLLGANVYGEMLRGLLKDTVAPVSRTLHTKAHGDRAASLCVRGSDDGKPDKLKQSRPQKSRQELEENTLHRAFLAAATDCTLARTAFVKATKRVRDCFASYATVSSVDTKAYKNWMTAVTSPVSAATDIPSEAVNPTDAALL